MFAIGFLKIYIGEKLIYNIVLVSGEQQHDSVIYIYIFQVIFPMEIIQMIEKSHLCSA